MDRTNALVRVVDQPALDAVAKPLSDAIREAYSRAGETGRVAKNALHGVWLGHPLHPVFTDVPIGAWTTGLVLDAVGAVSGDEGFERAADAARLHDNTMIRAKTEDADALLVRQHGGVCGLAHACSHLGGPLSEGTLKDGSVVCPWHGSEFALDDGHVVNGPATVNQPTLDVRERNGRIEIKAF
ncbi:MAG TPA: Rieske (2Fe-2S) protein [Vicinamibacterales bacterium]|nr:Rieske (2Fe-2S) protein [Vicinamibacterales bacterium]